MVMRSMIRTKTLIQSLIFEIKSGKPVPDIFHWAGFFTTGMWNNAISGNRSTVEYFPIEEEL